MISWTQVYYYQAGERLIDPENYRLRRLLDREAEIEAAVLAVLAVGVTLLLLALPF